MVFCDFLQCAYVFNFQKNYMIIKKVYLYEKYKNEGYEEIDYPFDAAYFIYAVM